MSRPENRTWYRVALARLGQPSTLVAARGEHLGAALDAATRHVPGSWPIGAAIAEPDVIPLGESVGKDHVIELGEPPVLPAFHWPIGILPALDQGEALAGVRPGFAQHPDPELLVIEAVAEADQLVDVFLGLVEKLPAADNLEVRVLDHFEDAGVTDVWLTSRVDARRIIRFLDDHDELIEHGHVELSIYVREHEATLRLTEHKTVVWLAKPGPLSLEDEVVQWLGELGQKRIEPFVTLASVPHYHYRSAKSRDRKKLGDLLYRQRLRRVASERPEGVRDADTAG